MLTRALLCDPGPQELDDMADVLHATVHAGASVSFILPFSRADAWGFWKSQLSPKRRIFVPGRGRELSGP